MHPRSPQGSSHSAMALTVPCKGSGAKFLNPILHGSGTESLSFLVLTSGSFTTTIQAMAYNALSKIIPHRWSLVSLSLADRAKCHQRTDDNPVYALGPTG